MAESVLQYIAKIAPPKTSTIGILNLGCARNTVDSEIILSELKRSGYRIRDAREADIAIINTCGFIEEAKRESIDEILSLIDLKRSGSIQKIIIAGCLGERYTKELEKEFQEVDAVLGVLPLKKAGPSKNVVLTPGHYAYVKICESCMHHCHFCIIPKIKGKFSSRDMRSITAQTKELEAKGVKELIIIGQDVTSYGIDRYKEKKLTALLKKILKETQDISWIRLLYTHPAHIADELLELMAREPRLCSYLDVPLQHISDRLLKKMNRRFSAQETLKLIRKIRKVIPDAALRTSFIVGLPGETEKDFQELTDFVKMVRFDRAGVFTYSREEGTKAFEFPEQVPAKIKRQRHRALMRLQQTISAQNLRKYLGKELSVLVDEIDSGKNIGIGRSEYDAPEVDGVVFVHGAKKLKAGKFVNVRITDSLEYDLVGESL